MTEDIGLGNELNRIVQDTVFAIFTQGELAQLSHSSFSNSSQMIRDGADEEIEISYPIGYKPTKEPMMGTHTYGKEQLIQRFDYLTHTQIATNGIYQLAMLVEAMLSDIVRKIVLAYPGKLGSKKQVGLASVLKANSLEELRYQATNSLINELSYKSPRDFAVEVKKFTSVNLLECPAYHIYMEMKATRDGLIHNRGIANEIYESKAGSHARVKAGTELPINQIYFLEVYESCLQLLEWLEEKLHKTWHSSERHERKKIKNEKPPESDDTT